MKLIEYIENYTNSNALPFHMPGHKRNLEFAQYLRLLGAKYDLTEIYNMDDLHNPKGIIKHCTEKAEKLWKSECSFLLVNGSTAGILAGIRACTSYGDTILVARNCHKSVYNAIELCGLNPIYNIPKISEKLPIYTSVNPDEIRKVISRESNIKLIILTSPTYEGIISNIREICTTAHKYGIPVLVDEAHGAHLDLSEYFTGGAIGGGADIVIQSLHKTLPSLTQTAILHINSDLVSYQKIKHQLSVFQTSSPSYIFISSIDSCIELIQNKSLFRCWNDNLNFFRERVKYLKNLKIINYTDNINEYQNIYCFDNSKIVISTSNTNINGNELSIILRKKFNIELEMCSGDYAIAMTSMADSRENIKCLANALLDIDSQISYLNRKSICANIKNLPEIVFEPSQIQNKEVVTVEVKKSFDKISAEYIWIYPPGIPVITPGEKISDETIQIINTAKNLKLNIQKTLSENLDNISIIK